MAEELSPAAIDCILYNLKTWRRLVSLMEPRTSCSVVTLPVSSSRGASAVEKVAVKRAVVTGVLDEAERALQTLTPELRQIASLRYTHHMTYREIARVLTKRLRRRGVKDVRVSTSTVYQKVEVVRVHCAEYLTSVDRAFWGVLRTWEVAFSEQNA